LASTLWAITGARQGELAPLTVANIGQDEVTGVHTISITEDEARSVRLKTGIFSAHRSLSPDADQLGFLGAG
jgi:hypothetical protein